jgi:hypothetical protein
MEIRKTLMNAFLVNTWLVLLCSVPTVQFSVTAFPIYARFTEVDLLFGAQVQPYITSLVCCLFPAFYFMLPAACCLLPVACYLLPAVCSLLPAIYCY